MSELIFGQGEVGGERKSKEMKRFFGSKRWEFP